MAVWLDLLHFNLSVCLQEVPLNIGRAGACVVVVKLPWACIQLFFCLFFVLSSWQLRKQMRAAGRTNKAGDQGRVRRGLWVFFCFPFNSALQMVLRERGPSHHYEPLSLSLVDRPAPLGSIPHSSHSHPIKNFHRLGWAVTRAKPLLIFFFSKVWCPCGFKCKWPNCAVLLDGDFYSPMPLNTTIFWGFCLTLMSAKLGWHIPVFP